MSSYELVDAWLKDDRYTQPMKGVIVALASFTNGEAMCWPRHATLAKRAGVSPTTARAKVKELVEDGVVEEISRSQDPEDFGEVVTRRVLFPHQVSPRDTCPGVATRHPQVSPRGAPPVATRHPQVSPHDTALRKNQPVKPAMEPPIRRARARAAHQVRMLLGEKEVRALCRRFAQRWEAEKGEPPSERTRTRAARYIRDLVEDREGMCIEWSIEQLRQLVDLAVELRVSVLDEAKNSYMLDSAGAA